jgi:hypothetical protein
MEHIVEVVRVPAKKSSNSVYVSTNRNITAAAAVRQCFVLLYEALQQQLCMEA